MTDDAIYRDVFEGDIIAREVYKVLPATTFTPDGFGKEIFESRYAHVLENQEKETWEDACYRVASYAAQNEEKETHWREIFYHVLVNGYMSPGGRVWRNAGSDNEMIENCVSGETLINTKKGLVKAKDLEGKTVNILTVDGEYRPAEWYSYGEQQLYRIETENGETIYATSEHEWLTYKNGRKRSPEVVTTEQVEGKRIPLVYPNEDFEYDEKEFRLGVQHGLIFGDGSEDKNVCLVPQFEDSRHLIYDWFDEYTEHELMEYGKIPVGIFRDGSLKNRVPNVETDSRSYIRGFIAGFIAADGHVTKTSGAVQLWQSDYKVLQKVKKLASHVGLLPFRISMGRELSPFDGSYAPSWKLSFISESFDEKMILKNSHKENFKVLQRKGKNKTVEVISVEPTQRKEKVYCCTEPETNTMVVGNGIATKQCTTQGSIGDSREDWSRTWHDVSLWSSLGAGWGADLSLIRPEGAPIKGFGGNHTASGPLSVMTVVDSMMEVIRSAGGRRGAIWFGMSIRHPDIDKFINAKRNDNGDYQNMNLSVSFIDESPEEFFEAVKQDKDWELSHPTVGTKIVKARDLWTQWFENMVTVGDPAIMNFHKANEKYNCSYVGKLTSCNACTEQTLLPFETCTLTNIVLPRVFKNCSNAWMGLDLITRVTVRFLDNLIENCDFVDQIPGHKKMKEGLRRIGVGFMGLAETLVLEGYKYSSDEGIAFGERLAKKICLSAYDYSVELAKERGSFEFFDPDGFLTDTFAGDLPSTLQHKIVEYGIRHSILTNCPPTGTTSIVQGCTGGLEPMYGYAFTRRVRGDDGWTQEEVVTPLFREFVRQGKNLSHFQSAYDVSPEDQLRMLQGINRWIDANTSKTVLVPSDYTDDDLEELIMKWAPKLVAFTFYRVDSKEGQPITPIPKQEAVELALAGSSTDFLDEEACRDGSCEI